MRFLPVCLFLLLAAAPLVLAQSDVDKLSMRGNAAQEAGRFEEAIACWDAVLKIDPKDSDAYYNRANAHKGAKQWDAAFADLDAAQKLAPKDLSIYDMRASLLVAQSSDGIPEAYKQQPMLKKAIAAYADALQLKLEGKENPLEWLKTQVEGNQIDSNYQKVVYWRAIVKLDPKTADVWLKTGLAEENVFNRAGALAAYAEAIRLSPDSTEGYEGRIRIYQRLKMKDDGPRLVAACSEIIRLKPSVEMYSTRGNMCRDMGLYPQALADAEEVLKLSPGKMEAYYQTRAYIYTHKKDWDKAIEQYNEILKLHETPSVYSSRARLYFLKEDYDHAIEDYSKYIEMSPNAGSLYSWRADAYAARGDYGKAVADYAAGMNAPNNPYAYLLAAKFYANCRDPKYRDVAKALTLQTTGCELTKWNVTIYIDALASYEAETGAWDKAVEHEQQAIKMAETNRQRVVEMDKAYDCESNWYSLQGYERDIADCTAHLALFQQKKTVHAEKEATQ